MNHVIAKSGLNENLRVQIGSWSQLLRSLGDRLRLVAKPRTKTYPPDLYQSLGPLGRKHRGAVANLH